MSDTVRNPRLLVMRESSHRARCVHCRSPELKVVLRTSSYTYFACVHCDRISRIHPDDLGVSEERPWPHIGSVGEWWTAHGLSVTLALSFVLVIAGQAVAGFLAHNQRLAEHGRAATTFGAYLRSAHFYEAVFENWESEFLQMAIFVQVTTMLRQAGSPESKRQGAIEPVDVDPREATLQPNAPWSVGRGGLWLRLHEHSLVLAFGLLFVASIAGHAISGAAERNAEARMHGGEPTTASAYLAEPRFWFESFQNWQSEILALLAVAVLSIYLRQRGSPESTPAHADLAETSQ